MDCVAGRGDDTAVPKGKKVRGVRASILTRKTCGDVRMGGGMVEEKKKKVFLVLRIDSRLPSKRVRFKVVRCRNESGKARTRLKSQDTN